MMHPIDESEKFDEGVDRKQLAQVKRAFLTLNQEKYTRTLACLSERQQQFLKLLPLLFHINHPMLPGYISHETAAGVHGYNPSDEVIQLAKHLARSFSYARNLLDKHEVIDGLFIMGSSGTIAHTESSDIDIWVCCTPAITAADACQLQEKCQQLTHWAVANIHLEINFFIMDAKKFSQGQQATMSGDASGSAQRFLLLDEFYRSAIWLAGKIPLWWFVPAEQERNYADYSKNLLEKLFLRDSEVIDFGGVPKIPANEFIGAGVWQLYKGIDAPYKSVLKLLLLEVYASKTFSEPVSLDLKRKIYAGQTISADELDAYVLVYQRLESYLLEQQQLPRLELVRRCFYIKAGKSISKSSHSSSKSWKKMLLEKLIKSWGWQPHQIVVLDSRPAWKAAQVVEEYRLLANELHQGYRLLLELEKNSPDSAAINNQELLILGRKLHAAFERKAGKVDWINPHISQDISEPSLCFVQSIEGDATVWKVYRGSQQELAHHPQFAEKLKRSSHFIEALLWCYCNEIIANHTRVDIVSKSCKIQTGQLHFLLQAIQQWLPLPRAKLAHEVFTKNLQPGKIMLLFNIGAEPQSELQKKGMQMLSNQRDAFGFSGLKENLVITADIVHSNSWGEVVCRHFDKDALLNCLLHYLRLVPPHKNTPLPRLAIHCFSAGQGSTIEQRVKHLWSSVIHCFYAKNSAANSRFIFEMAGEYFLLQFIQQQPQIFRFNSYEKLLEKLAAAQSESSAIVIDALALGDKPLRLICEAIQHPEIYLFYRLEGQMAHVSIMDHKGSLFSKALQLLNSQTLLRPLYHFIHSAVERQLAMQQLSADAPGDLGKIESLKHIHIYEILGDAKQKNAHLEARSIDQDISQIPFINICAMAEPVDNLQLRFTIFCEGKEFSEIEFGDSLYAEVARYILQCRQSGEMYPCYITDLDLSRCQEFIAPHTGIQLIHYLQIKMDVEHRLSLALQGL